MSELFHTDHYEVNESTSTQEAAPAYTVLLTEKLTSALSETEKELTMIAFLENNASTMSQEELLKKATQDFSSLKRFTYEPGSAQKFVESLFDAAKLNQEALSSEKNGLLQFKKSFERDLEMLKDKIKRLDAEKKAAAEEVRKILTKAKEGSQEELSTESQHFVTS